MRRFGFGAAFTLIFTGVPAAAQDGALDMGLVTGDAAMSHLQQHEERRARRMPSRSRTMTTAARARSTCANKSNFRARLGATDPRVRQLYMLCQAAGY